MLISTKSPRCPKWASLALLGGFVGFIYPSLLSLEVVVAQSDSPPLAATVASESLTGVQRPEASMDERLRFSFERAAWREVITWISDECDLALQYETLPTGSFSYKDPRSYSEPQAIDRINLFLLPQGFTLVRSGQLLSVINLSDPRSMQQLDALAQLVSVEQLVELNRYEVVKCMFALTELSPQDAVEELSVLNLMTTPKIFNKTNQLMITDTVAKLLQVREILNSFKPQGLENGTVMESFPLQHVSAEDVLLVARPHLGLATGEMIGIDVSLSTDLQGQHIFVTGVADKVKLVENLVKSLDQPLPSMATESKAVELRSHLVSGGNLETVYNVLKTLLAGKSLRLTADSATSSIVALASPEVQTEIAQTVEQLQAAEAEFEVIPLKRIDPYMAITLLQQMLDLPDEYDDLEDFPADLPKIDADPGNRQLFVRAKPYQIAQIKKIVAELESGNSLSHEEVRVLPLHGKQATEVLSTATKLWRESNPIMLLPSAAQEQGDVIERVLSGMPADVEHEEDKEVRSTRQEQTLLVSDTCDSGEMLSGDADSLDPVIRCQVTPQGLLLESEDADALQRFESQLRAVAGPLASTASPPVVFYLRYTKAADALRLLAELLDGGESAREAEAGKLVRGYVASPGAFLGSIMTSQDGTSTMMAGTMTVVADSRLNRLIAQGTGTDIDRIEGYLKIIDKDSSLTDIETYGTSRVIELMNTNAGDVAAVIRDAYSGRIVAAAGSRSGEAGAAGIKPDQRGDNRPAEPGSAPRDDGRDDNRRDGAKGQASQPARNLEPQLTIAVHDASNSLIVTAPEQLFREVEKLARLIDTRSEQMVEVLAPENAAVLQAVLQPESTSRSNRNSSNRDGGRGNSRSDSQSARIMEMLRGRGR